MSHPHPEWSENLVRAGLPFGAALLGGLAGAAGVGRARAVSVPLVHFAAGAFLAVALVYLLPEAAELASWPTALLAVAAGVALCGLLARTGAACPACDHQKPVVDARLGTPLLLVIAVHGGLDGMALAGAGDAHHTSEVLPLAMLLHKLPEGLAVAAVCRASGLSFGRTLFLTALVESPTFLGLGLGMLLGSVSGPLLGAALGAVAGSFLYLVWLTLLGRHQQAPRPALSGCVMASGAFLVLVARLAGG